MYLDIKFRQRYDILFRTGSIINFCWLCEPYLVYGVKVMVIWRALSYIKSWETERLVIAGAGSIRNLLSLIGRTIAWHNRRDGLRCIAIADRKSVV